MVTATERRAAGHSGGVTAVQQLAQGRGAAPDFEALYEEHVDGVWRLLQRFGVPEAGLEDAVQEVFLIAHRRLSDFRGESTLRTWLGGISLRVAKDARRAQGRRGGHERLEDHAHLRSEPQLEEVAMQRQALARVLALLQGLEEAQREVFVLAELEGFTAPEIAAATQVNVNTVYTRLRSARLRFNALVGQQGEDLR
jgi:RNA polymerase sigma-70 factor (ECF subfamily)